MNNDKPQEGAQPSPLTPHQVKQKDINDRIDAFRKDLQAIINKHQIYPDPQIQYSNKGSEIGIVLIDTKYNESLKEHIAPGGPNDVTLL